MKIGLYFGSFNPVHHGHLIIASHVINSTDLQQVWMVVSPQNPLKPSSSLLNEYQRLFLVNLALDGEIRIRSSNIEFHLPKPCYTVDTMAYLSEKYPEHEFAIIMGGDSLQNIKRWKNYETLLKRYTVYVYNRQGFTLPDLPEARIRILNAPLLEISSTHIRELIKTKRSFRYLVPDSVMEEIMKNNYYR